MMMVTILILLLLTNSICFVCDPEPGQPPLDPMGVGKGINPGRVAWNWRKDACSWDGKSDFWWKSNFLNYTMVSEMLDESIKALAGETSSKSAWKKIFQDFNRNKFGIDKGYSKGERIAIKLNAGDSSSYEKNGANGLSPQFFKALIHQLVDVAGVEQSDITAYDASRWIQVQYWDEPTGISKEYPDVNFVDPSGGKSYVEKVEVDYDSKVFFSNRSVSGWNITKLPKCLTSAKYMIEVAPLRGHSLAGITELGKNWFGSIYNDISWNFCFEDPPGHWCPAFLHRWVNITGFPVGKYPIGGWMPQRPMKVYNPIVDLLGLDDVTGKGLIYFSDAFYGGLSQMYTPPLRFQLHPFDNSWSCSLFASQDPIALDSVLFDLLRSDDATKKWPNAGCSDNYLHESALADNPPSGVYYAPSGVKRLSSLGVHEHWNNPVDKQYSRNLGKGKGIELVKVFEKK